MILISALDPAAKFEMEPGRFESGGKAKGALLTKMIYGLAGSSNPSELVAAAKIEMYADAIEDLPAWAIDLAIKRWARGECPSDIQENPRFDFPPAPAVLRMLALLVMGTIRSNQLKLECLLAAVPIERAVDPTPLPAETLPAVVGRF